MANLTVVAANESWLRLLGNKMRKIGSAILILLLLVGVFSAIQKIASSADYVNNDFLVFWLAGYSNWAEIDPYTSTDWLAARAQFGAETIPEPEFLYPLPLAILLAPLGLLPLHQAFIAWGFISACLIIISIIIVFSIGKAHPKTNYLALPIFLFLPLFPPILLTLYLGQLSAFLFFLASLATYFWHKERWFWGGFFVAFFTLKPSIGLPLLAFTSLWLFNKKHFRAFGGMLTSSLLLLILGLLRDPYWVSRFLTISSNKMNNTFGYSPTIWGISGLACHFETSCTVAFGAIAIILFVVLNIWLLHKWKPTSPALEFGLILVLSLLSAPYLWPYDQLLLLIPILLSLITLLHKNISPIKIVLIFLGIAFFTIGLGATANQLGHQHENLYVYLSILVWGISVWILKSGITLP